VTVALAPACVREVYRQGLASATHRVPGAAADKSVHRSTRLGAPLGAAEPADLPPALPTAAPSVEAAAPESKAGKRRSRRCQAEERGEHEMMSPMGAAAAARWATASHLWGAP